MVRVHIDGDDILELAGDLDRLSRRLPQVSRKIELQAARYLFRSVKEYMISSTAVGRTYVRYNPYRVHTASAPGQPPAIDTGSFLNSIYIRRGREGYYIGSTDFRASIFEYGSGKIAPRPWFFDVADEARDEIQRMAVAILDKELRRAKL